MPDLKDCITSAIADGHMSRDAGEEYIERYDELAEAIGGGSGKSWFEAKTEAAVRLQGEIERKLRRKKRMRLFHARSLDRLRARAVPGVVDKAMRAVLDFDPRLEHVGPNVSMRHESLKGSAFALMSDFVDRFRSKAGGLTREKAGMGDVVKGLFGEKTTPEGKAFAEAVQEARFFLVHRHNAAGGDIQRRKDWGWVQHHDRSAVAAVDKIEWVDYVLARMDPHRMLNEAGEAMTERELRSTVESSYDSILLGGIDDVAVDPKFGSPVNKRITHRELVFTDSKAWLEYQEKYGSGSAGKVPGVWTAACRSARRTRVARSIT